MKILVIANLNSGKGKAKEMLPVIQEKMKDGNELKIFLTENKLKTLSFVAENCNNFDMLIVLGGDGTMNEVVSAYVEAGCNKPIGYIPTGSTNDFASSIGIPTNPHEACENFKRMKTRFLDVGTFNGEYFSYVAAAGAFSRSSYATPVKLKQKFGHLAYILDGIASVPTIRPQHIRITADNETIEGDYIIALISNSFRVAGVFSFEKDIVFLDDGKFEVAVLKSPEGINEFGSVLKDVLCHKYNGDYIDFITGSDILIESPEEIPWSLDGEYGGSHKKIHIKVLHNAINIIV